MARTAFPLSNVRVRRLYQAACLYCLWKGTVHGYSDRHLAEDEKRAHVAEHRRGQSPPEGADPYEFRESDA